MSRLFLIFLLIVCFSRMVAQDGIFGEKANHSEIISELFEGNWNPSTEECVWKPNFFEKSLFGESYNGLLYTKFDTAFSYKTSHNTYFVLIASTFIKVDEVDYEFCSACSPSLSIIKLSYNKEQKLLQLESFDKFVCKYGSYGTPSEVSLFHLWGDDYCIKVNDGYSHQGYNKEYITLYYEGNKVLSFPSYADNENSVTEESKLYKYDTSIFVDKENKRVLLNKKGRDFTANGGPSQVVKVNETTIYEFNNGVFEKLCH